MWSFSTVDTFLTSKYTYFLKKIKNEKPDAEMNIYGIMGNLVHDTIEELYKHNIEYEQLIEKFKSFWDVNIGILDIKFNRTDSTMNDKIKNNYYKDLYHFMVNHEMITDKMLTEQFILIKIGKYYFQGYIDSCIQDCEGNIIINDWKTSSIYQKKDIEKKAMQLQLYSYGLYQKGVPIQNIKACWNFMKYVIVNCKQINGNWKERKIERCKIGTSLQGAITKWLKKLGYSEIYIEETILKLLETNSIDFLDDEIKNKFEFHDCVVYIDITKDTFEQLEKNLSDTIDLIEELTQKYYETHDEMLFWDSDEDIKKQEYYFFNLSDYTANKHKPFKKYLETLNAEKKAEDILFMEPVNNELNNDMDWINNL